MYLFLAFSASAVFPRFSLVIIFNNICRQTGSKSILCWVQPNRRISSFTLNNSYHTNSVYEKKALSFQNIIEWDEKWMLSTDIFEISSICRNIIELSKKYRKKEKKKSLFYRIWKFSYLVGFVVFLLKMIRLKEIVADRFRPRRRAQFAPSKFTTSSRAKTWPRPTEITENIGFRVGRKIKSNNSKLTYHQRVDVLGL